MTFRQQKLWGWPSATEMFSSGAAAGAYLVSVMPFLLEGREVYFAGVLASIDLLLVSFVLLMVDMPSIWLVPRSIANLRAPQARGAIGLMVFGVLSVVTAGIAYSGVAYGLLPVIVWVGALAALVTMAYPGLVMGSMRSIPFWHGATPILLILATSVLSGCAVVSLIGGASAVGFNMTAAIFSLLVVYGVILFAHVAMANQGLAAARASVRQLSRGSLSGLFWVGVVLVGIAVPLVLVIIDINVLPGLAIQIGSFFILAGGVIFRYCMLASAIKAPNIREDAITATYWMRH